MKSTYKINLCYTLPLYLFNFSYIALELYKFNLRDLFNKSNDTKYIDKAFSLSQISLYLEYLMLFICISFLVVGLIYYKKKSDLIYLKKYIVINTLLIIGTKILSIITSKVLLIAPGNLFQQNIPIIYVTLIAIALTIYAHMTLSKKTIKTTH